jgi:hypothetical protein
MRLRTSYEPRELLEWLVMFVAGACLSFLLKWLLSAARG